MMPKVKITAYADEALVKRLKNMAENQDRSVTYLVEKALIEAYGKRLEK